ncbi:pilus assembly protein PilP [Microbulbifer flavimaris]|uniref:Pilus assembly protein PilP n=1 Tax=Microbulbifer flavimaris TaxID=1781068 RepID=A0ABX4HZH6_9GAMM|nr:MULTISPECIES: pilus assembly protein PilP [Microbulbifer]KUJ82885.1 pilus assembly protein PilP [Microbulbifer sp. ZGT114]PCO05065.1 pilus assembly protein PilP [Microbulbifer flavimaris]
MIRLFALALTAVAVAGCSLDSSHSDLRQKMAAVKAKPKGQIEPIPTFTPYSPYVYSAAAERSPFTRPVLDSEQRIVGRRLDVAPDSDRRKELLERFNFDALSMVGTLSRSGQIWALVDDGEGGIHRITVGNYLGKNHGRVVSASAAQVDVLEIVPDGTGGWIERPRALTLEEKDNQ